MGRMAYKKGAVIRLLEYGTGHLLSIAHPSTLGVEEVRTTARPAADGMGQVSHDPQLTMVSIQVRRHGDLSLSLLFHGMPQILRAPGSMLQLACFESRPSGTA
mmetsp:Transcript_11848/g.27994  ORF Transcript_11848/g.27994 Transcript_11848/m.27994 type:complete len:103 (-) Transcript_11848:187-495(-)